MLANPMPENTQIWSLTGTVQYDLWKNVITVSKFAGHGDEGQYFSAAGEEGRRNTFLVAANVIYKF